jgi:hypothetical protein
VCSSDLICGICWFNGCCCGIMKPADKRMNDIQAGRNYSEKLFLR